MKNQKEISINFVVHSTECGDIEKYSITGNIEKIKEILTNFEDLMTTVNYGKVEDEEYFYLGVSEVECEDTKLLNDINLFIAKL
jgi:hypothetical protein